eukprot:1186847-Prorocentrum_minimum.AAC.2
MLPLTQGQSPAVAISSSPACEYDNEVGQKSAVGGRHNTTRREVVCVKTVVGSKRSKQEPASSADNSGEGAVQQQKVHTNRPFNEARAGTLSSVYKSTPSEAGSKLGVDCPCK